MRCAVRVILSGLQRGTPACCPDKRAASGVRNRAKLRITGGSGSLPRSWPLPGDTRARRNFGRTSGSFYRQAIRAHARFPLSSAAAHRIEHQKKACGRKPRGKAMQTGYMTQMATGARVFVKAVRRHRPTLPASSKAQREQKYPSHVEQDGLSRASSSSPQLIQTPEHGKTPSFSHLFLGRRMKKYRTGPFVAANYGTITGTRREGS